jgi:hypothetical protein
MRPHAACLLVGLSMLITASAQGAPARNWPMFGGNVQSTSANLQPAGITTANVRELRHRQVKLDGLVDASAIYLHGVTIQGARHDAAFVTSSYGKTIALDADSGAVLWEYTPASYRSLAGTLQFTNSTPVADPAGQFIYAASPDGYIEKLAVGDGRLLWRTAVTRLPVREKMDSPLKLLHGRVIAVTAGYVGDRPPYQGHLVILDAGSGKVLEVWNSLCSNRARLMRPSSCPQSRSAIWGRAGAVIDPRDGRIFIATGNGDWNGRTDWGNALLELDSRAREILGNYTPPDTGELSDSDLDLGSTSPVLLADDWLAQGGKDGCSAGSGSPAPRPTRDTSCRSFPLPAVPSCSVNRRCGSTMARPGCLLRTTAAPRPGSCEAAGCTRNGTTRSLARVHSRPTVCCSSTTRMAASMGMRRLPASASPRCPAVPAIGTVPSWWMARSYCRRAMPTVAPPRVCWTFGRCPPGSPSDADS